MVLINLQIDFRPFVPILFHTSLWLRAADLPSFLICMRLAAKISVLDWCTGPGCSKLTTSLVNVSLKFQTLISQKCQYFLLKKCEKLLQTRIL